jgi:hypothetical protein
LRDMRTSLLHGTARRERRVARPRGIKPAGAAKVKKLTDLARHSFHLAFQQLGWI